MTAQRQETKGNRYGMEFRPGIAFFGIRASLLFVARVFASPVLAILGALAFSPLAAQAATTERVIVNRYTGLAIECFSPVFVLFYVRAMIALPEFDASQAGAFCRFRNEGNRASFVAHPD